MFSQKQKRVIVSNDIDLKPYTVLRRGEKGTLVYSEGDDAGLVSADILMDQDHKGLALWGNTAHIAGPELSDLKFADRPRMVSMAYSAMLATMGTAAFIGVAAAETADIYFGRPVEMLFRLIL